MMMRNHIWWDLWWWDIVYGEIYDDEISYGEIYDDEISYIYMGIYMVMRHHIWGDIWWWDIIYEEIYDDEISYMGRYMTKRRRRRQYLNPVLHSLNSSARHLAQFWLILHYFFAQSERGPAGASWWVPLLVVLNQALASTTLVPAPGSRLIRFLA